MKTRNGFVSNSSSSSFIIALKSNNNPCPTCGRKDLDFLDMIKKVNPYSDDNKVDAVGEEEILHYYKREAFYYDDNSINELKAKMDKYSDKEWKLAAISISYHDEILRQMKDNLVSSGNMEIIRGIGDE